MHLISNLEHTMADDVDLALPVPSLALWMASSEVDQKALGNFAAVMALENPLLSAMLYKVLGLSVMLSKKLLRARRLRRLDTTRETRSLQLYHHITWLSREGLIILEGYVLPMVQRICRIESPIIQAPRLLLPHLRALPQPSHIQPTKPTINLKTRLNLWPRLIDRQSGPQLPKPTFPPPRPCLRSSTPTSLLIPPPSPRLHRNSNSLLQPRSLTSRQTPSRLSSPASFSQT
jgi:hypothetical protein